ncbi:MAG TPA: MDR family MFS transporter [Stellaceae bacterium]|nr:MDR family MFS transporter [Stellaceae bacterium]
MSEQARRDIAVPPSHAGTGESRLIAGPSGRFWILTSTVVLIFMTGIEGTVVATAMPTIIGRLGGFELFSWVFSGYFLAQGVTIPIYGRLADLFGRKRVLFFGLTVFLIGTTACGFAPNMLALVIFRIVQGVGAGAVQPINQTLIGDLYPPAMRAKMAGFFSSIWGIAAIIGPVLGAFVISEAAWNWIFWITVPIGVVAFLLLALALHERIERRPHRIDYLGAAMMALGIGLVMYAFIQASSLGFANFLLLIIAASAILALFLFHERRAAEPILPLTLWRNRVLICASVGCFGVGCVVMASTTFLPAYIQGVMGRSPIVAGYALAVTSVTWIAGSWAGGQIMLRGSYRAATAIGGIFLVIGAAMLIALDPARGPLWAATGTSLVGIGMGLTQNTYTVAAQSCVDWSQRGTATSLISFMRMLGQTVGGAIYGGVVNLTLAGLLGGNAVNRIMDPALRDKLSASEVGPVMLAVGEAIRNVYWVAGVLVLLIIAAGLSLPKGLSPTNAASRVAPARPEARQ